MLRWVNNPVIKVIFFMSRFTTGLTLINASTTSVTDPVSTLGANTADVSMRTKLSIKFIAASITSGNGVFKVYVSNDGANWVQYNRLTDNVTNTNVQNDTRVASVTLSSNGSKIYFFPVGDYFRYIGVSLAVTTDGAYSVAIHSID